MAQSFFSFLYDWITLFSVHIKSEDGIRLISIQRKKFCIESGDLYVTQIWFDAQHVCKSALKKKTGESVGSLCNT